MPRWNALPEDLEPQIEEFTGRLRRLVDDSGLSIAALADRTGYGKTSWERYLGGRLLAPKGAVIALAEATGTDPGHLTTLWEVAERAWTRAELRHDRTLTAARITAARAALGDLVTTPEPAGGTETDPAGDTSVDAAGGPAGEPVGDAVAGRAGGAAERAGGGSPGGASAEAGGGTSLTLAKGGGGGAAAAPPAIPAQPADSDAGIQDSVPPGWAAARPATASGGGTGSRTGADGAGAPPTNSWGLAGYRGPSQATARPGTRPPTGPAEPARPGTRPPTGPAEPACADARTPAGTPAGTVRAPGATTPAPGTPAPGATGPREAPAASAAARRAARRQQVAMFFAGLVGAGALIAGVFYVTHGDGAGRGSAGASPSPSASALTSPPPGVKCAGAACTGKDAESMGCSGELVSTAKTATVGTTTLEVRYSKACGAAWGRITSGAPGDTVRVTVGKDRRTGDITAAGDTIGYTPMIAVRNPAQARACATLATGQTGCTE
ncbi:DUF2690 domain-containing protein [Streptomyces sp. NRRL S-1022]|uniref:DUF2690 domain-containing protein n=1 Tax=Streptomyces sp. NRRL S-1022 TaxID=1463880 RepID=UPI0004C0F37B|nr:DUF2690 domain-containing protein [Streptomyces sp. NRRL S-1022]